MKCTDIGEQLMDMATGSPAPAQVEEHLRACAACAERLTSLRQTMNLLDEWQAPEPSPYFHSRLAARVREAETGPRGWLAWLRKPALAGALAALLFVAGMLIGPSQTALQPVTTIATSQPQPGTAVGDLQDLEKNHEIFSNFDMLDDLSADQPQSANP
jgi:anti-sigma factor RsiW